MLLSLTPDYSWEETGTSTMVKFPWPRHVICKVELTRFSSSSFPLTFTNLFATSFRILDSKLFNVLMPTTNQDVWMWQKGKGELA
jgi:hypothetical protein